MTLIQVARQGLKYYGRAYVTLILAVAVASAVLTGALVVGDSMQYTLSMAQKARLGEISNALAGGDRFFRTALAQGLADSWGTEVAPVVAIVGMIAAEHQRLNQVHVYGIDERFMRLWQSDVDRLPDDGVILSDLVAQRLDVKVGDSILLRWERPSLMPQGAALTPNTERSQASRLTVRAVLDGRAGARFGLQATQVVPLNVFVPIEWLARQLDRSGRANLLLAGPVPTDQPNEALARQWQGMDAGLSMQALPRGGWQLQSQRVFLDEVVVEAAQAQSSEATLSLTYFVNELRHGRNSTPYSIVAALGPHHPLLPEDMGADEMVVNQWLADDLGVQVGDRIVVNYWIMGQAHQLQQADRSFRVCAIVPMAGAALDPNLMPDFTGLADMEDCGDWEPGTPVDLNRIRDKDEAYWDDYRGTPKAFVSLDAGQAMWASPYGRVTAVRFPAEVDPNAILSGMMQSVSPASLGLSFRPVRALGDAARAGGTDFGGLFLGLSMFLIGACIILIGLLFVFNVENRHEQIGLLAALGWPRARIKAVFLVEGGVVAGVGAVLGAGAGLGYTQAMLWSLQHLWQGAINHTTVLFHANVASVLIGGVCSWMTSVIAMTLVLRKQVSLSARELLTGIVDENSARRKRRPWSLLVAILSLVGAVILIVLAHGQGSGAVSGAFFGAGTLLLVGWLLGAQLGLKALGTAGHEPVSSLHRLGWRNVARRPGRSVAVIGLLAFGIFVVVAVGTNRKDPMAHADQRARGTGGFALYGESTLGIMEDLNARATQEELGLNIEAMDGTHVHPLRVHAGDEASCLNLNRTQQPRLLGVDAQALADLQAFCFNQQMDLDQGSSGWELLDRDMGSQTIAVIGDYPTVYWGLGKRLGDELDIQDQQGRTWHLQIVGMLGNSILQGSLLMAEDRFERLFPADVGARAFLIDCPQDKTEQIVQTMSDRLVDYGLLLTSSRERLADFAEVENTYLSIFTALGGLGLILGTLGLGLVVLRNVLECRSELALLRAVGFEPCHLGHLVVTEHVVLLVLGLVGGVVCALVAVTPALQNAHGQIPLLGVGLTVLAIGLCGWVCVDWAARVALRGPILDALRNE